MTLRSFLDYLFDFWGEFWIILLLFSCKEPPVLPLEGELSVDIVPPIIKWISPRFDAVVNEIVAVQC